MSNSDRGDSTRGTAYAKARGIIHHNIREERQGWRGSSQIIICHASKFGRCPSSDGKHLWWMRLKGTWRRELVRTLLPTERWWVREAGEVKKSLEDKRRCPDSGTSLVLRQGIEGSRVLAGDGLNCEIKWLQIWNIGVATPRIQPTLRNLWTICWLQLFASPCKYSLVVANSQKRKLPRLLTLDLVLWLALANNKWVKVTACPW